MSDVRSKTFRGLNPIGFHTVHYTEFGSPSAERTAVCVHGLTRNSRDFDLLATALARKAYVVCPDIVGRGKSDWLPEGLDYSNEQYLHDLSILLGRLDAQSIDWIGTSMGGILGMILAARQGTPIKRLILNDIGPFISRAGLSRIGTFVGLDPRFDSIGDLEGHLRNVHAPFGDLTDQQWRHLATHSMRHCDDGRLALAFDPAIARPFQSESVSDIDLWPVWDRIECPVLVLRGATSDILLKETAREMEQRGPAARVVEFPECGHAPSLLDDRHIGTIEEWLDL